tara:strand:- start:131 stop:853 length:723 start_codon:yes stop_codon:yes gene_type:complete
LSESFTKTKLIDPLILILLQNIRGHRSNLENLESIEVDPKLSNIISNEKGKELYIENEFHKAKGFRKLHIEVAEFSKRLKILHCVFFPDPKYDIPIFGMDLVKINEIVSAAIVDLSPSSKNQNLKYDKLLSHIDKSIFENIREIPEWGDIFSENVFFASLKNESEKKAFCSIVDHYLFVLIQLSQNSTPDNDREIIEERINFQKNYCLQQMKNEKTSLVLINYFEKKWVDEYIKKVLFDF